MTPTPYTRDRRTLGARYRRERGVRTREHAARARETGSAWGAPIETDAETERLIVRLRQEGMSYPAIRDYLTEEGIPTARGARWHIGTIAHIVKRATR